MTASSRRGIDAFLAAAIIFFAGCSLQPEGPPALKVPARVQAPLKLCKSADVPPSSIAEKPGYSEFAVSVTDAAGDPVKGLKQEDFRITRSEKAVPIEFFRGDNTAAPVSIVVVLDSSGSMANKLGSSDASKIMMVRNSIGTLGGKLDACDEVALITFAGSQTGFSSDALDPIRMAQPFTTDRALLMSRLNEVQPYGTTPLYDSIHDALEALGKSDYPQRAMIVITDGMDNVSKLNLAYVVKETEQTHVPIYSIGMGDPKAREFEFSLKPSGVFTAGSDRVDADVLKQISNAGGGETFIVSPADKDTGTELTAALTKINAQLASEYTIGVIAPDGETPEVAIPSVPDAKVSLHRLMFPQAKPAPPAQTASQDRAVQNSAPAK